MMNDFFAPSSAAGSGFGIRHNPWCSSFRRSRGGTFQVMTQFGPCTDGSSPHHKAVIKRSLSSGEVGSKRRTCAFPAKLRSLGRGLGAAIAGNAWVLRQEPFTTRRARLPQDDSRAFQRPGQDNWHSGYGRREIVFPSRPAVSTMGFRPPR